MRLTLHFLEAGGLCTCFTHPGCPNSRTTGLWQVTIPCKHATNQKIVYDLCNTICFRSSTSYVVSRRPYEVRLEQGGYALFGPAMLHSPATPREVQRTVGILIIYSTGVLKQVRFRAGNEPVSVLVCCRMQVMSA